MPLGVEHAVRGIAKRARRGLFAGRQVRFGNKISEDGENKSRRKWKPNVQTKRLFSETLDKMVPLKVTTHALRCIDKAGGLDNYLMNTPEKKLASDVGMALRKQIDYWQRKNKQIESEAPASENESQNQAADSVDSK